MKNEIQDTIYELGLPSEGELYTILKNTRATDLVIGNTGVVLKFYYDHQPHWAMDILYVNEKELCRLQQLLHNFYYIKNFRYKYRC